MRTAIIFMCAAAFAATAFAECDFPYYPEYADVYSQYDEVTPLMAKKAAMVAPPFGVGPDAIICEPLLVRDINRMPIFYAVAIYSGGELNDVKKWNAIIREINAGKKIPAAELAEKLKYFSEEEVRLKFNTLTVTTYTFDVNARNGYGGTPMALRGYFAAYAKAKELLNSPAIYFVRIISASFTHKQILEFENDAGNKVYIKVKCIGGYEHSAEVADLEKNAAKTRRLVEGWYTAIKDGDGPVAENLERWFNTQERIEDERANEEFPRIEAPFKDSRLWLLDFDPIFLEDVPDPVQTWAPGVCWTWAIPAIFTYHAQHGGPRFVGAPDPGHWGKTGSSGNSTDEYVKWVQKIYYKNTLTVDWGDTFSMCVKADSLAKECTFQGTQNPWLFTLYSYKGIGESWPGTITHTKTLYYFSHAYDIINEKNPVAVGLSEYGEDEEDPGHMCPGIGFWWDEAQPPGRWLVCYDMLGDRYDVYLSQDWQQTPEGTDWWEAIKMEPPGPGIVEDTWVKFLTVKRDPSEHVLSWAVGSCEDVKGFNIYNGTYDDPGARLNDRLITPDGLQQREFSYTVESPSENAHYVIELVRITEDEHRFLFPEEIYQ